MVPLIICRALGPMLSVARVRNITRWAAAFMLFALLIAPAIAYSSLAFHFDDKAHISPRVAMAATEAWGRRIASPLRIATGTEQFSLALPFYSSDAPVEFTHYSYMEAPWITPERIAHEGILHACSATDASCIEAAETYATAHTTRLPLTFHPAWGLRGAEIEVVLIMTPPRVRRSSTARAAGQRTAVSSLFGEAPGCRGEDVIQLVDYAWFLTNAKDKTHPMDKKKPNASFSASVPPFPPHLHHPAPT
jgi:hypothetical protein